MAAKTKKVEVTEEEKKELEATGVPVTEEKSSKVKTFFKEAGKYLAGAAAGAGIVLGIGAILSGKDDDSDNWDVDSLSIDSSNAETTADES